MTREEAIKWLEEAVNDTNNDFDLCSDALKKELLRQKDVFEMAVSALKFPQGEWISVEDGLPIKSGEYFVYTTDENISTAEFDEDCGDNGEFGFWNEYYQDGVYLDSEWVKADWITHWMPLPEPPEDRG